MASWLRRHVHLLIHSSVVEPRISFQSSPCTIVKCGRLNGTDALLINCTLSNLTLVTAASHISLVVRIGHTRITHKYLLSGDRPLCDKCQCSLTVKHILLECCSIKHVRENYFTCSSLKALALYSLIVLMCR